MRCWPCTPHVELAESGLLEQVAQIRDDSFARRLRERLLPSQEVLAQRMFRQTQELADVQRHLQRYHALLVSLRERLREMTAEDGGADPRLPALLRQLNDGLARALATESVDVLDVMDDMLKLVSAQVTLRPSGHQFTVEGRDSLLQAGMRAGLKLNYGCGNGSCGMCKVRLTAGQVVRTMATDYPLSEVERAQGYVLACAHTAASGELTIETLEASGPAEIPLQQLATSVRAVRALAPDTMLLHLQTPRSQRLRFLAGQAVTLGLTAAEGARATYGVASCPCDDRNLQFFVARDEQDALAVRLFARCGETRRCGDAVGPQRRVRAGRRHPPAGVPGVRPRHRADQEPDRTCAVARCRTVDHPVLAGHPPRRAFHGQPMPCLVGGARPLRVHAQPAP